MAATDPTARPDRADASAPTITTRRRLVATAVAAVLAMALSIALAPQHQRLSNQHDGDAALAGQVREVVGSTGGWRSLAVAEVTVDSITWAGVGNRSAGRSGPPPGPDTRYELGSIAKTFTAALFADAIERGEVRADDTLGEHLSELSTTAAGGVTLGSLAQHRSGLPPLGATAQEDSLGTLVNENPYHRSSTEQLIMDATVARVDPAQPPTYSNFGVALLGTALVRATGAADYPSLVAERITGPLGMHDTTFTPTAADVPEGAVTGHLVNGTPAPRWDGEGYLPAGTSTFTTVHDMALWAQAQLTGRAPGVTALEPSADFPPTARIGWAWLTSVIDPGTGAPTHEAVWHNGITAGFSTVMVLDRSSGRAVVVLGNSTTSADPVGFALLYDTPVPGQPVEITVAAWFTFGLAVLLSLSALLQAWRRRALLPAVTAEVVAVFGLLLLWHSGPWTAVGGWAFGLALAPAVAAAAIVALRTRTAPFLPARWAWLSWTGLVVAIALVVGVIQLW